MRAGDFYVYLYFGILNEIHGLCVKYDEDSLPGEESVFYQFHTEQPVGCVIYLRSRCDGECACGPETMDRGSRIPG